MYEPVLMLNANFEPLHVCTTRRAICLVLTGKADLVLNGRPRPRVRLTKREVLRRDNYICQYCGKKTPYLTIDHVFPRRLGGEHSWENLVAACPPCNHRKGGRTLEQAHMNLLHLPKEPPASTYYLFSRHLTDNIDWQPFIEGW